MKKKLCLMLAVLLLLLLSACSRSSHLSFLVVNVSFRSWFDNETDCYDDDEADRSDDVGHTLQTLIFNEYGKEW